MERRDGVRPRRAWQWLDVRGRGVGQWAYALNRLTGLGLTLYLYVHLGVLATLARGPAAWDAFIALVKAPVFLALDVVVLAGLLLHGLAGLRVTLLGLGVGVRAQRRLTLGLLGLALLLGAYGAWRIFSG